MAGMSICSLSVLKSLAECQASKKSPENPLTFQSIVNLVLTQGPQWAYNNKLFLSGRLILQSIRRQETQVSASALSDVYYVLFSFFWQDWVDIMRWKTTRSQQYEE